MPNEEAEEQHARVARMLGVDLEAMTDHPYDLQQGRNGSLLVRWHDQAPDGIIRDGEHGSYTTYILPANVAAPQNFVEGTVKWFHSA